MLVITREDIEQPEGSKPKETEKPKETKEND